MSAEGDERGIDQTARIALGAVALVVLLVIGTLAVDALRRDDSPPASTVDQGGNPPSRKPLGSGATAPLPDDRAFVATAGIMEFDAWRKLLARDPRAAAVSVAQMPADDDRDARLTELMIHWTEKAPATAGEWLLEQAPSDFRAESSAEFTRAWADRDPAAAARWIGDRANNPAAVDAIGGLIARWTGSDADAAREWAESLGTPAARATASAALAYTWAQSDARAASTWVAQIKDPTLRAAAAKNLVNAWSVSDPRSAANWLSANLREPNQRDAAALPLLLTWADTDPHSASKWVAALPGGQLQEQSKAIFAEALAEEAPNDAITWAESIGDSEQRNESILNIYESWMENDKPALLAHLRENLNSAPVLRNQIYEMLFEHDPEFRAELIGLYEGRE